MSELKAFDVGLGQYCEDGTPCVVAFDADKNPRILNEKVYLKSEVDRYISELIANQQLELDEWYCKVEHHKFKLCLDKAKICQLRLERYEQYVTKYKDCNGPGIQRWRFLKDHYEKWYMRWRELAEQFKPNSTATKENNNG